MKINIEYCKKLTPIFTKPKRIKIVVGGRGSAKSTAVADYVAVQMMQGSLWCCAREQLNSIEESVHRTLLDEIDRLNLPGFQDTKTSITHASGGRCFYRGLARNITSLKSTLSGVDGLWIEEGEDLSSNTLRVLTASVRLNAKDTQRALEGEEVKMPEILITMNRGSRKDAMSEKFLKRAESELARCGYYEDELMMVVEVNYTDIPQDWFLLSGLEQERVNDEQNLSPAEYEHKWLGGYMDTVENAIIQPHWFDACIDAHIELGFKAEGQERVTYDPADSGDDKAIAYIHGVVVKDVQQNHSGEIDTATDWATGYANNIKPDVFIYDAGGMGTGLKRQIATAFKGKRISIEPFNGASGPQNPDSTYDPVGETQFVNPKSNKECFFNLRAQMYWALRDRIFKTYQAVIKGDYINPDDLISFSSKIEDINQLRAEVCRIPRKPNGAGKIQILSKVEMKKLDIDSPNMADAVMMSMRISAISTNWDEELVYDNAGIL
jgi:phage terminase large subunit